jgi:hypothetical protein
MICELARWSGAHRQTVVRQLVRGCYRLHYPRIGRQRSMLISERDMESLEGCS